MTTFEWEGTHGAEWRSREDAVAAETARTAQAVPTEPLPE
jgi:hypothetical protein